MVGVVYELHQAIPLPVCPGNVKHMHCFSEADERTNTGVHKLKKNSRKESSHLDATLSLQSF